MGWLIPKRYLRWREPKIVRRTRETIVEKTLPRWVRPLGALIGTGLWLLVLFPGSLMNNNHAIPPGITVLVALMLGVFYAYVVPWLYRFETSEVIVAEKWIRLLSGDKPNDLRYEKMSSCQIVSHEIEGQKISILA